MEATASWGPYEFELPNWTVEVPAAEVWDTSSAFLHDPVEYTSIDIFGTCCSLEAHVPESIQGQQQLVDYYYSVDFLQPNSGLQRSTVQDGASFSGTISVGTMTPTSSSGELEPVEIELGASVSGTISVGTVTPNPSSGELEPVEIELKTDIDLRKEKMHRYPASLRDSIDKSYTMPRIVTIGPYYRHSNPENEKLGHLKQAEDLKRVAVIHCARNLRSHSAEPEMELHAMVDPAVEEARRLYDKDIMAGINSDEFRRMMLYDACFLVQFMFMYSRLNVKVAKTSELERFLRSKREDFLHDLTLLENQLPWQVVEPITTLAQVCPKYFVKQLRNWLQDQKIPDTESGPFVWDGRYKPPHLLGLLRYYTVGRSPHDIIIVGKSKPKRRSVSTGVRELEKIGIKLTPNKTAELIHMGLCQEGFLHGTLFLAPLALNHNRASHLVNMAALELCTVERFADMPQEDTAVCSYLRLLAMMAYRVEDVHELREKGLLQGGGGLTDDEALRFFSSLQGLRLGRRYIGVMQQIQKFQEKRSKRTKWNACWYDNKKTMAAVLGFAVSVATIVGTLASIKSAI